MPGSSASGGRASKAWLAAPAAVLFLVAFVVPLTVIVAYSFGVAQPFGSERAVAFARLTLENYQQALGAPFVGLLIRTLGIAAVGTAGCLVLGFPVAYTLATRVSDARKPLWLALLVVPFLTSFLLRTFAWRILLSGNGPVSTALQAVGALDAPLDVLDTSFAVQLGVIYNYLPLMILPLFVAIDRIDPRLRDASRDLGAGPWRTFWRITLPLSRPGVVSGCLLVFIPLSGEYVTPAILGGARGMMAGSVVASQFLEARNWPVGAAEAVVLVVLILTVATVATLMARVDRGTGPRAPGHRSRAGGQA